MHETGEDIAHSLKWSGALFQWVILSSFNMEPNDWEASHKLSTWGSCFRFRCFPLDAQSWRAEFQKNQTWPLCTLAVISAWASKAAESSSNYWFLIARDTSWRNKTYLCLRSLPLSLNFWETTLKEKSYRNSGTASFIIPYNAFYCTMKQYLPSGDKFRNMYLPHGLCRAFWKIELELKPDTKNADGLLTTLVQKNRFR